MSQYTDKQLEAVEILKNVDVPAHLIDDILKLVEDPSQTEGLLIDKQSITDIKLKMVDEKDWRKKAVMAAMLISKNLEE